MRIVFWMMGSLQHARLETIRKGSAACGVTLATETSHRGTLVVEAPPS